eukprot:1158329-Pelagomonas_calceolata.AAC.3
MDSRFRGCFANPPSLLLLLLLSSSLPSSLIAAAAAAAAAASFSPVFHMQAQQQVHGVVLVLMAGQWGQRLDLLWGRARLFVRPDGAFAAPTCHALLMGLAVEKGQAAPGQLVPGGAVLGQAERGPFSS